MLLGTGTLLVLEGLLFLFYVKFGKFHHRDRMLSLHQWRGDEQVLDVRMWSRASVSSERQNSSPASAEVRQVTGIDIWSNQDMGGNSEAATRHNLELEGISDRCTLLGIPAQEMTFPDGAFDVIVSNLCLHNIYDRTMRRQALQQIVRVLKPGGVAILSDYKHTAEYAQQLRQAGLMVERRWGNPRLHFSAFTHRHCPQASAILAVEEFPHRLPPGLVHFRVQALLGGKVFRLRFATGWATVRETGLIRLQLKLFRADGAGFYRERHNSSIVIDALQLL